ncbi:MAG: type II toxin-antitoxin system PemK/MazF family toxin [Nitratiruptor sp.]|nr:type II toxin-antitoxin system PemK/MazF family toxin [Nitratiruptor sp.]NPA84350.1 type II toxin-antitoxin system PemK/MazF family toxin [Campylobacterota bacterium]
MRQGEIYLVNFKKRYNSEFGKVRPALVLQNDFFNRAIEERIYRNVLVVPLSTQPIEDDYRIFISKRQRLEKDSYIVVNWVCTLDIDHVLIDEGVIATISEEEFAKVQKKLCEIIQRR